MKKEELYQLNEKLNFKYTLKAFNSKFKMFHLISLMFSVKIHEVMHCFINSIPPTLHISTLLQSPTKLCPRVSGD